VRFTASPRAARLLSRREALPLLRVQPLHFQGTIEATWRPFSRRSRVVNQFAGAQRSDFTSGVSRLRFLYGRGLPCPPL